MDISTIVLTICVVAFTAVSALIDVRTHRVPNWLTVSCLCAALVFHFTTGMIGGGIGKALTQLLWAVLGFATGFSILWVLWATAGGLGGDVKLMGALGAWLMPSNTLYVYLVSCGLVVVLLLAAYAWAISTGRFAEMRKAEREARRGKHVSQGLGRANWYQVVPYGVFITLATWVVLAFHLIQSKGYPFL